MIANRQSTIILRWVTGKCQELWLFHVPVMGRGEVEELYMTRAFLGPRPLKVLQSSPIFFPPIVNVQALTNTK